MPKILRIVNRFNLGGPVFNAAYLTKYLPSSYETLLIGGQEEPHEDSALYILNQLGISYEVIPELKRPISLANDYAAYKKIKTIIQQFNPDIVHTHASKAGLIGRLAAYKAGIPIIVHTYHGHVFHSYFGPIKTSLIINLERYLARKTTKIITISSIQDNEIKHFLRLSSSSKKTTVIPLGIDTHKFIPPSDSQNRRASFCQYYHLPNDAVIIGIIGRLVSVKNHALFLSAFAKAKNQTKKKLVAVIVGDGDLRSSLEKQADLLGLSTATPQHPIDNPDIIFTSWIRKIETIYPVLDIVALSSVNEGTPVSLIEAQAAEKIVVSTNVGGVNDTLLFSDKSHILSPPNQVEHFAQNLLFWIENKELREKTAHKNAQKVREFFHYNRLVNDIDDLYKKLFLI